jgi:hypothetical protein
MKNFAWFSTSALLLFLGTGCESLSSSAESQQKKDDAMLAAAEQAGGVPVKGALPPVDLSFLLSMDYKEASALSAQSVQLESGARIAAEKIEIVKTTREGKPKKVKAEGKVFLETGAADGAKILCQEAIVSDSEAVLRGKPILQRGGSIVEGLDQDTVFYMLGSRLRVIGKHRLTNPTTMVASLPGLGPWTGGPNPLLPPLTESAVPRDIRAEMLRAAEAEAVLQKTKSEADQRPTAPPAPWVKDGARKSEPAKPADRRAETKGKPAGREVVVAAASEAPAGQETADADAAKTKRKGIALSMRR